MIETLVPASVATVCARVDLPCAHLFAAEVRSLGNAVAGRRREFVTGRACARRALGRLGVAAGPIPSGEHGEPLWPPGVVGSITHCAGLRACAVARSRDVRSLGIDAEVHAPLPRDVLEVIATPAERRALAGHPAGVCWDRLLFSAKEAVFKAWFPLTGQGLGFEDVEVRIDPETREFRAWLPGTPRAWRGRWQATSALLATAVVVPCSPESAR